MDRRTIVTAIGAMLAAPFAAAQERRLSRVGVIFQGGPYAANVEGLRAGLKNLGLVEGRDVVFHVRDVKGDLKATNSAARQLEREKVDVIYSVGTSTTLAVKNSTDAVPVVFYAGTDPAAMGLIANYRAPGGRFTGIYSRFSDLTPKRLELLKTILPKMRRTAIFYNPQNPVPARSMTSAREAARRLKFELIERHVRSVPELRAGLDALRPGEVDAVFTGSDAMVISQSQMVVEMALAKKMPTMVSAHIGASNALASYGVSHDLCGRLAAKYVQRILAGAKLGELPVEQIDTPHLAINLKVAKILGIKIPEAVLARADEVID